MTTLTIGRFSMSDGPSAIRHDGDFLELELQIDAATTSTPAEAKVKRQQLLGMVDNPDEGAFPLTFSDDSDLDGFYSVLSVQCEPFEMFLNNGTMMANVSLRRVANGYQNPTIETTVVSRLATNSHSVASTTDYAVVAAWNGTDEDFVDFVGGFGLYEPSGLTQSITAVDGSTVRTMPIGDTNVSGYWARYGVASTYYNPPSCAIEYKVGSTWYTAVNRQIPTAVPWRINNGVVRIGADTWPSTNDLRLEVADSSAWVGRYINGHDGAGGALEIGGYGGPFIVRNSPEMVVVKVITRYGYATYSVWSGGTIAMIAIDTEGQDAGLVPVSTEAGTNVTGGIRTTANDANGNRLVLLCREAVTTTTGTTQVNGPAGGVTSIFSAGFNLGATGSGLFSEAGQLGQLCTPPQWRRRIAAR